jgi:hypothetical protein
VLTLTAAIKQPSPLLIGSPPRYGKRGWRSTNYYAGAVRLLMQESAFTIVCSASVSAACQSRPWGAGEG